MSRGTPIHPIRIPPELMQQIEAEIEKQDQDGRRERETLTEFVLRAIRERIDKRRRSRVKRKPRVEQEDSDLWDARYTLTDTTQLEG